MQQIIEKHWYKKPIWWLSIILLPLSYIFSLISKIRYYCYSIGILKQHKLPIPVVIIGNISVGGVGKTPLTKYLVQELARHNIKAGVILRGYKGSATTAMCVNKNSDSNIVGDEALIYAAHSIPVAIGRNRYLAGLELLKLHPQLQIILSDDGLQHYALMRDYEVVVLNPTRIQNNLHVLPMGALREPISRLKQVNAIILSGNNDQPQHLFEYFNNSNYFKNILLSKQTLKLNMIHNPVTQQTESPDFFNHIKTISLVATGDPQRFFNYVHETLKINTIKDIAYPDHYYYTSNDIMTNANSADAILVTEKDYTKIAQPGLKNAKIWVISVEVRLDNPQLINEIIQLVK